MQCLNGTLTEAGEAEARRVKNPAVFTELRSIRGPTDEVTILDALNSTTTCRIVTKEKRKILDASHVEISDTQGSETIQGNPDQYPKNALTDCPKISNRLERRRRQFKKSGDSFSLLIPNSDGPQSLCTGSDAAYIYQKINLSQ